MSKKLNYTLKFCFLFLLIAILIYKYCFFIKDIHSVLEFYKEYSFLVLIPFLLIVLLSVSIFLDDLPSIIIQSVTFIFNIILMILETLIEWFAEVASFSSHAEDFTTPLSTSFLVYLNLVIMIFKIVGVVMKKNKKE